MIDEDIQAPDLQAPAPAKKKKKSAPKKKAAAPRTEGVVIAEENSAAMQARPPEPPKDFSGEKTSKWLAWKKLYGGGIPPYLKTYDKEAVARCVAEYEAAE